MFHHVLVHIVLNPMYNITLVLFFILLFLFSTGLEFALKCVKHKNYQSIEAACREELNKTGNNLIRITLTLNLLATISILCSNYAAGIKYLSIVIRTPEAPRKVKY